MRRKRKYKYPLEYQGGAYSVASNSSGILAEVDRRFSTASMAEFSNQLITAVYEASAVSDGLLRLKKNPSVQRCYYTLYYPDFNTLDPHSSGGRVMSASLIYSGMSTTSRLLVAAERVIKKKYSYVSWAQTRAEKSESYTVEKKNLTLDTLLKASTTAEDFYELYDHYGITEEQFEVEYVKWLNRRDRIYR